MGQKVRRSQVAVVKNPPANAGEARVRCLGWEDPLVNGMAIHSSILAWRVPWTEPGGLQSMRSQRVSHTHTHTHTPKEPESHGQRSLADYSSWDHKESDTHTHQRSPILGSQSQTHTHQRSLILGSQRVRHTHTNTPKEPESDRQRSLVDYSPWDHKESVRRTERDRHTPLPKRTRTHTHPKEPKAGFSVLLLFVVVVGSRRSKGAEP